MKKPNPKLEKPTPPARRALWVSIVKWLVIAGVAGAALGCATIALVFWMYGRDPRLPNINRLEDYHPKQVTTILDSNDRRIGELYTERRTFVPYSKIPPLVVDAFIAAEDNRFWSHGGIDYTGMARAFVANLRAGHAREGASTITQQVVKNLLLTPERSFRRKIQEIILARRLEKALSKEEIMTIYLNQIYFGRGRYGIQEAARFYFGKDVSQLDIGEAAVLASLPKEPEKLGSALISMRTSTKVTPMMLYAKERQKYVLGQLREMGKLTPIDAQKWMDAKIQIIQKPFPELGSSPEWIDLVRKELIATKGDDAIDKGGTVRTTMQPELQEAAQRALQAGLRVVDKHHGIGHPVRSVKPDKVEAELTKLAKKRGNAEPGGKEVYDALVTSVHDDDQELEVDLGKWPATIKLGGDDDTRYNPDGKKPSERFKIGDVVDVIVPGVPAKKSTDDDDVAEPAKLAHGSRRVVFAPGAQGAVVIMDVKTRKVRALVGGYSSRVAGFDRATMAKRQPGSSFKPIVYTAAYERAAQAKCHANDPTQKTVCATPATVVNDAPEVFDLWRPKNFETGEYLGPVRLRDALAKSINTVSIRITYDIKPETVVGMAHRLGIASDLPNEMSLALGAGEVTPLELVNAYATLADGGVLEKPKFIDAYDGVATPSDKGEQVVAPEIAYVMTDTMRSVVTEGTGAAIGEKIKAPIAGKTGTSNDARDTWFIGATPDYVIGVWIGYDDNRPMPGEQGAKVAAPVFLDIAQQMNLPNKPFVRPPHVVEAVIDRQTGLLAPDGAPKKTTLTEVFVEGTQPTDVAPKPGEVTEGSSVTGEYGD
ncbi:MAG TPA: transglycosylase domain-containing protein [Kofleriaceae bacterium]|jgi:penicillin-binding protein 1A|nr:transglycosylase domain-containing protein [Kofleriaceae bacterium]